MDAVHIGLDIAGLLLIGDKDTLRAGRDNNILQSHAKHRYIQFIENMHILTGLIQHGLADAWLLHGLGQGVPGAHILPLACKAHDLNLRFILNDRIIEADLLQRIIFTEKILIIGKVDQLMCLVKHIAQLVGKYAAVPKRTLRNVLFGCGGIGLFLKGLDRADGVGALRNDVAVLFAGIGRLNAHEREVGAALFRKSGEIL